MSLTCDLERTHTQTHTQKKSNFKLDKDFKAMLLELLSVCDIDSKECNHSLLLKVFKNMILYILVSTFTGIKMPQPVSDSFHS